MRLPKRLRAIAELIPHSSRICDIGTDHGLLPVWLIKNGMCSSAIATDISAKCLSRAVITARDNEVYNDIQFICSDGLTSVDPNNWDTLIVAGMGGETIIEIIDCVRNYNKSKTLILQANTKLLELSQYLRSNGFQILNETMVREHHHDYLIMKCFYPLNIVN